MGREVGCNGFVVQRRGKSWWLIPLAYPLAVTLGVKIVDSYTPSSDVLRHTLVTTGVPAFAGAGPIEELTGCRMLCSIMMALPGDAAMVTIVTTDVERTCRQVVARLVDGGWSLTSSLPQLQCGAALERPARMEQVYLVLVGMASGILPPDANFVDAPPIPGKVLVLVSAAPRTQITLAAVVMPTIMAPSIAILATPCQVRLRPHHDRSGGDVESGTVTGCQPVAVMAQPRLPAQLQQSASRRSVWPRLP